MILIKNGRVVDPVTGTDEIMDVLVDGNTIAKTGKDLDVDCAEVIDATGLVIAPGLVDTHVHFRDPGFTYKYRSCGCSQGRIYHGCMYGEYKACSG